MKNLFRKEPELTGRRITLRLMREGDADALAHAAADGALWTLPFTSIPPAGAMPGYVQAALDGFREGTALPFVTVLNHDQSIVGSTRFWKMDSYHRRLEIGHTWIARSWQKTFVNTEAKYLMLCYAFEELHCIRVQFVTDERNQNSQQAILRLGAQLEGKMRYERIMADGYRRNSMLYSIIDCEWPEVKRRLAARLS